MLSSTSALITSLVVHLCMRAGDDGFLNNAKKIQRMVGANDADLQELLEKAFPYFLPFGRGGCNQALEDAQLHQERPLQRDCHRGKRASWSQGTVRTEEHSVHSDTLTIWIRLEPQVRVRDRVRVNRMSERAKPKREPRTRYDFTPPRRVPHRSLQHMSGLPSWLS